MWCGGQRAQGEWEEGPGRGGHQSPSRLAGSRRTHPRSRRIQRRHQKVGVHDDQGRRLCRPRARDPSSSLLPGYTMPRPLPHASPSAVLDEHPELRMSFFKSWGSGVETPRPVGATPKVALWHHQLTRDLRSCGTLILA